MSDKWYCISNNGEVDINAFFLMGASTKDGESKIGYFGTGIKYAIATAMRNNIPLRIFSGKTEITFSTQQVMMRDIPFNVVYINGEKTGITTNMGRDWQPWFVVREFYCNALDEGSSSIELSDDPVGIKDTTRIYIGCTSEIHDIITDFSKYFSTCRESIISTSAFTVYLPISEEMTVYRRGLRVFYGRKSIYDYDLSNISMNEARQSDIYSIEVNTVYGWREFAVADMINTLASSPNSFEYNMNWSYGSHIPFNDAWWLALADRVILPKEQSGYFPADLGKKHIQLPHQLCVQLFRQFCSKLNIRGMFEEGKNDDIVVLPIEKREKMMLSKVIEFLKQFEYFKELDMEEIKLGALDTGVAGQVFGGAIYIAPETFHKGMHDVVRVLIEEWCHLKSNKGDFTREFQDELISIIIDLLEEQVGVYL